MVRRRRGLDDRRALVLAFSHHGLTGEVCAETGLGTWKAHGFPASLWTAKKLKAAGGSPCASHPNVIVFTAPCDSPRRISARRMPKGFSLWGARNDNRPHRTPDRRRRRAILHWRNLRRPPETTRAALRRSRPRHALAQLDRRPRPLRAADEIGRCRCGSPNDIALAITPTALSDKLSAAVASVVYRGCAIPVAWVRYVRQQARQVDRPRRRSTRTAVGRYSRAHEGNRDDCEKPKSVRKDTLAPLLDRNGIQCAQERGLAASENPSDRPREGGAPPTGFVGGGAADACRWQRVEDAQALKKSPSGLGLRRKPRRSATVSRAYFALAWRRRAAFWRRAECGAASGCCPNPGFRRRTA